MNKQETMVATLNLLLRVELVTSLYSRCGSKTKLLVEAAGIVSDWLENIFYDLSCFFFVVVSEVDARSRPKMKPVSVI